ncbi:hypothetical protein J6590_080810 [Homalodisca vitripennis]|nr:hypothetical protein J6590_080810 [Homalodisca vitripennis]
MHNETEEQENNRIRNFLNETLSADEELEDSFVDSESSEEEIPTTLMQTQSSSRAITKRKRGDNSGSSSGSTNIPQNFTTPPTPTMSLLLPPHHFLLPFRRLLQPCHLLTPHRMLLPLHNLLHNHDSETTVADPHIIFLQRHVVRAKNNYVWSTSPGTQRSRTPARKIVVSRRKVLGDARQAATP